MDTDSSSTLKQSPTEGRFALNAVIGAVVGFVLGFIPLSPAIGGALAGYLQDGTRKDGMKVGAASGAIAMIPALLLGGMFAVMALFGGGGARGFVVMLVFALVILVVAGLYLIGLGAAGGWMGIYLREYLQEDGPSGRTTTGEPAAEGVDETVADV